MKYLIVMGNISPSDDANTNIAKLISKELRIKGHDIVLFGTSYKDALREETRDGMRIYRLVFKKNDKCARLLEILKAKGDKKGKIGIALKCFPQMVKLIFRHLRSKIMDINMVRYASGICHILKRERIDCIIAITSPFYTVKAAIKVAGVRPVVWYQLDPYSSNVSIAYKKIKKREKHEEYVIQKVQKIVLPELLYREHKQDNFRGYVNKMHPVGFPNIRPLQRAFAPDEVVFDHKFINCVFVGVLYEDIRNPEYLMKLISCVTDPRVRFYFIGGGAERVIADNIDQCNGILNIYGRRSHQASVNAILDADVLINIGNTVENMLPSKVNDYISACKPIVNIAMIDNCSSANHLVYYRESVNIFRSANFFDNAIIFENFITSRHQNINFDEVVSLYKSSTAEYVTDVLTNSR